MTDEEIESAAFYDRTGTVVASRGRNTGLNGSAVDAAQSVTWKKISDTEGNEIACFAAPVVDGHGNNVGA